MTWRAVVALIVAASGAPGTRVAATERVRWHCGSSTVAFDGFGSAKVGMTVAEAERALRVSLTREREPGDGEPSVCSYYTTRALPGVAMMFLAGKLVRVDVTGPHRGTRGEEYCTAAGGRVGMSEGEILRLYPGIRVEPHPYLGWGHYLRVASPDGKYALIFETDETRTVTSFRGGLNEAVILIEGCG